MEIDKLRVFTTLYETGNYTRTAEFLNMTQPGVTYIIHSIEEELDTKLFIRNKRHVVSTKKGKLFYQQIKPLINKYYSALQAIHEENTIEQNTVNIGCSYTPYHLKNIGIWIKDFHKLYPKVNFTVTSLGHNNLKKYLENEDIDLFFTSEGDASDMGGINFIPIVKKGFFAIVPKDNALSKKKNLNINDFDNQQLLFIDNGWTGVEMVNLQEHLLKNNKNLNVTYANDQVSADILINSLEKIAFGLDVIYLNNNSNLKHIMLNGVPQVTYGIVTRKNNINKVSKKFIRLVKDKCKEKSSVKDSKTK